MGKNNFDPVGSIPKKDALNYEFIRVDSNFDGKICGLEMMFYLHEKFKKPLPELVKSVDHFIKQFDSDGDDMLDFADFKKLHEAVGK